MMKESRELRQRWIETSREISNRPINEQIRLGRHLRKKYSGMMTKQTEDRVNLLAAGFGIDPHGVALLETIGAKWI